jgi:ribosome-associated toxin RatA of RatAB toxin-antitoxin module
MADEVSVERVIVASPDELWARVSDIERMGDLSPESTGGEWLRGATGPVVGARFKGNNQNGKKKWSTVAKVVESEPGRVFAFEVTAGPFKVARWTYRFEAAENGCRVTETWTDQRGRFGVVMGKPVSGVADRATHNRNTMAETLGRLASLTEPAG